MFVSKRPHTRLALVALGLFCALGGWSESTPPKASIVSGIAGPQFTVRGQKGEDQAGFRVVGFAPVTFKFENEKSNEWIYKSAEIEAPSDAVAAYAHVDEYDLTYIDLKGRDLGTHLGCGVGWTTDGKLRVNLAGMMKNEGGNSTWSGSGTVSVVWLGI